MSKSSPPSEMYPDAVDVTDRIEEHQTGIVFECDCGQGFGVKYGESVWTCPTCTKRLVDDEYEDREPPDLPDGQLKISGVDTSDVVEDRQMVKNKGSKNQRQVTLHEAKEKKDGQSSMMDFKQ